MTERITEEDEHKLIVVRGSLGRLQQKRIIDVTLNELKNILIGQLDTSILSVALTIKNIKKLKQDIDGIMNNINFEDDDLTLLFRQYLEQINNFMLLKEQQFKLVIDSYIEFIERINDLSLKPVSRTIYFKEGEIPMTESEKQDLKDKVTKLILYYKKYKENGRRIEENETLNRIDSFCDTHEKLMLVDDIFYDKTQDYILTKKRASEERKQKKESSKEIEERLTKEVLQELEVEKNENVINKLDEVNTNSGT